MVRFLIIAAFWGRAFIEGNTKKWTSLKIRHWAKYHCERDFGWGKWKWQGCHDSFLTEDSIDWVWAAAFTCWKSTIETL